MANHCAAVHAFEPYEPVRNIFQAKIDLNQIDHVFIHSVGVGDQNDELPFHAPAGTNLGVGSFVDGQENRQVGSQTLQVVRGDDYFIQQIGDPVHMVNMDVEGFEKKAIAGFSDTFARNRPIMVIELTKGLDCSFSSEEEIAAALPDDYRLFMFDIYNARGKKDKNKDDLFRKQGTYQLIPFDYDQVGDQVDLIAFPREQYDEYQAARTGPAI